MTIESKATEPDSGKQGRIKLSNPEPGTTRIYIPPEGLSVKGFVTIFIIILWLVLTIIWTILLFQIHKSLVWISIPFWLLGFSILRFSLRMILTATEELIMNDDELTLIKTIGSKTEHITFRAAEIESVVFVEGAYKALAGITRKGIYPAIINKQSAFGFGERCTKDEKQFLLNTVKEFFKH